MNKQGIKPTAKELYYEIKQENPKLIRNSFRSFVKIINIFPEIDMQQIRGKPATYLAKLK
jgi:hypothetical protein